MVCHVRKWDMSIVILVQFVLYVTSDEFLHECTDRIDLDVTAPLSTAKDNHYIISPNYPAHYPKNVTCSFRIFALSDDLVVYARIKVMAVGKPSRCGEASVRFYNGLTANSHLIAKTCYSSDPYSVHSRRDMYVQFVAGGDVSGAGFKVQIFSVDAPKDRSISTGGLAAIAVAAVVVLLCVIEFIHCKWEPIKSKLSCCCCCNCCNCCCCSEPHRGHVIPEPEERPAAPRFSELSAMDAPPPYTYKNELYSDPPPSYVEAVLGIIPTDAVVPPNQRQQS